MIVKIMGPENMADSDTRKTHQLLSGVISVRFLKAPHDQAHKSEAFVTFADGTETFPLFGNVYVMNDSGKTISSFGPDYPPPQTGTGPV